MIRQRIGVITVIRRPDNGADLAFRIHDFETVAVITFLRLGQRIKSLRTGAQSRHAVEQNELAQTIGPIDPYIVQTRQFAAHHIVGRIDPTESDGATLRRPAQAVHGRRRHIAGIVIIHMQQSQSLYAELRIHRRFTGQRIHLVQIQFVLVRPGPRPEQFARQRIERGRLIGLHHVHAQIAHFFGGSRPLVDAEQLPARRDDIQAAVRRCRQGERITDRTLSPTDRIDKPRRTVGQRNVVKRAIQIQSVQFSRRAVVGQR